MEKEEQTKAKKLAIGKLVSCCEEKMEEGKAGPKNGKKREGEMRRPQSRV